MKQIEFFGLTMALEHASFQLFKNTNFHIGIITPTFDLLAQIHKELVLNVKAINSNEITKLTEKNIYLSNGSTAYQFTQTQSNNIIKDYSFNMIFSMFQPLNYEWKMSVIPSLTMNLNSILYTVYDK